MWLTKSMNNTASPRSDTMTKTYAGSTLTADDCDDHDTGHTTSVNRGPLGHTPTGRRVPTFVAECLVVRCSWNVDGFFDRQSAIAAADAHEAATRHACASCGAA